MTDADFLAAADKWRESGNHLSGAYYDARRSALVFARTITICSVAPVQAPHFRIAELVPALEPLKTKQVTFVLSVSDYLHAIEFAISVAGNPVASHVSVPRRTCPATGVYRIFKREHPLRVPRIRRSSPGLFDEWLACVLPEITRGDLLENSYDE